MTVAIRDHLDMNASVVEEWWEAQPQTQCPHCGWTFDEVDVVVRCELANEVSYVCLLCMAWALQDQTEKEAN